MNARYLRHELVTLGLRRVEPARVAMGVEVDTATRGVSGARSYARFLSADAALQDALVHMSPAAAAVATSASDVSR